MIRQVQRRNKRGVVMLNLVSMIDMFTVLVFFLLITSSSVATLHNPRSVDLPDSTSLDQPSDTPVVTITRHTIMLQGQPVMSVADAEASTGDILPQLKAELLNAPVMTVKKEGAETGTTRGAVNIMADKDIPYSLLKKVMATCGDAEFAHISLSVNHVSRPLP